MKVAVRYYSKAGNTKKLAEAIANELNVDVFDVMEPVDIETEVLFLGKGKRLIFLKWDEYQQRC